MQISNYITTNKFAFGRRPNAKLYYKFCNWKREAAKGTQKWIALLSITKRGYNYQACHLILLTTIWKCWWRTHHYYRCLNSAVTTTLLLPTEMHWKTCFTKLIHLGLKRHFLPRVENNNTTNICLYSIIYKSPHVCLKYYRNTLQ